MPHAVVYPKLHLGIFCFVWRDALSITDWSMEVAPRSMGDVKYFSLEQADRSLVLLRRIVGEIVEEYGVLLELEEMIESAEQSGHYGQLETARKRLLIL